MSESHSEHRSSAAAADSDRRAALSAASEFEDGDATQTFAYQFSAASSDEGSEADSEPTVISSQSPIAPLPTWPPLRPRDLGQLLEGRKLDHFELDEFIGGGGMGAVFRARDTLLSRTVAVKVLATGAADNEETQLRFQNEAQSAARLDHPNIARVHYVGEAEGFKYIVFEYLEGKNLRDLVAEVGSLPLEDALNFTLQIAEALAHAWQRDIVHRDIKPSNVLATREGQVKLVDMGLARLRDVATAVEDLTASGVTLGTFDYISPEQARDPRSADIRSDIYSLGCTLYFMLCGRPPFQGGTAIQKLLMHQADEPPSPREYRPDLPPGAEQLLRRMLTKSPNGRFQNPAELIAAIVALADDLGIAVHPRSTVQLTVAGHGSSWMSSSLPWLVPAALLLACVFMIDYLDRSTDAVPAWTSAGSFPDRTLPEPSSSVRPSRSPEARTARDASQPSAQQGAGARQEFADGPIPEPAENGTEPGGSLIPSASEADAGASDKADGPFSWTPSWMTAIPGRTAEWLQNMPFVDVMRGAADTRPSGHRRVTSEGFIRNTTSRETFSSLAAACATARDGDFIEIGKSGPIRIDRALPIRIEQKRLTIRGAAGTWPVLQVFTNAEMARADGASDVFAVADGLLRLEGLEVELTPNFPIDVPLSGWKVFEVGLGGEVEVAGCWFTIRGYANADFEMRSHDDIFHVVGRSSFINPGATAASDEIRVLMEDVVVRGGDNLVSVEGDSDLTLHVNNGLFAIRGYLLDSAHRHRMDRGRTTVQMDHVTADLGQGGFRVRGDSRGDDFQVVVQNSILLGTRDDALIEHFTDEEPSMDDLPLVWRGRTNIYSDWGFIFRRQVNGGIGSTRSFFNWQTYWAGQSRGEEADSTLQPVPWRTPRNPAGRLVAREPADYRIDHTHPLIQAFPDAGDRPPGMIAERLWHGEVERDRLSETNGPDLVPPPVTEFVDTALFELGAGGRGRNAAAEGE